MPKPILTSLQKACKDGNLDLVKELYTENKFSDDSESVRNSKHSMLLCLAFGSDNLELVKYLTSKNIPLNFLVIQTAVFNNKLEIVRHLLEIGAPIGNNIMHYALISGNDLEIVKCLYLYGLQLNSSEKKFLESRNKEFLEMLLNLDLDPNHKQSIKLVDDSVFP
jgi:ankyrin repeat protein